MISKLDSLNLNTSTPTLNTKMEVPTEQGFGEELSAVISLASENASELKSPNQVSADSEKTLTENKTEEAMMNALLMNMLVTPQAQPIPIASEAVSAESMMAPAAQPLTLPELQSQGVVQKTELTEASLADAEKAAIKQAAEEIMPDSVKSQAVPLKVNGKEFSLAGFEIVKPQKLDISKIAQENMDAPELTEKAFDSNILPVAGLDKESMKQQGEFKNSEEFSQGQDRFENMVQEAGTAANNIKDKVNTPFAQALEKETEALSKGTTDQIVTHARTVVTQGGGEMNLKLNPEGLGPVDLKVGVKNGVVNIEIHTQDVKTKKIFEDGIADIRNALETQNLRMDTLKVNMSERPDGQLSQHGMMSEKDFARQFMGQFRDERQGFRQQSMTNAFDRFRAPTKEMPTVGLRPSSMNSRANGSSRLNVVG